MSEEKPKTVQISTGKKLLFALILLVLPMVALLFLGEFGAYVYLSKMKGWTTRGSYAGIEPHPYMDYRLAPGFKQENLRVNDQGFRRDEPVEKTKPEGVYRIFMLGGSTMYGSGALPPFPVYQLKNEDTISYHCEDMLNEWAKEQGLKTHIEVINAAASGYSTYHHFVQINQKLTFYDPDMIVFLDGHNDYYRVKPEEPYWVTREPYEENAFNYPSYLGIASDTLQAASERSWLAFFLYISMKKVELRFTHLESQRYVEDPSVYPELSQKTWQRLVKINASTLQRDGVAMMLFLQPELALYPKETLHPDDQEIQRIEIELRPEGYYEMFDGLYAQIQPMLEQISGEFGFDYYDCNQNVFLDGKQQYFSDYAHITRQGNEQVAAFMAEKIKERLTRDGVK